MDFTLPHHLPENGLAKLVACQALKLCWGGHLHIFNFLYTLIEIPPNLALLTSERLAGCSCCKNNEGPPPEPTNQSDCLFRRCSADQPRGAQRAIAPKVIRVAAAATLRHLPAAFAGRVVAVLVREEDIGVLKQTLHCVRAHRLAQFKPWVLRLGADAADHPLAGLAREIAAELPNP